MSQPVYDPPKQVPAVPGVKECCLDPDNLVRERIADDKVMDVCRVCGCRHRRMFAETADLTARGVNLTGRSLTIEVDPAAPQRDYTATFYPPGWTQAQK